LGPATAPGATQNVGVPPVPGVVRGASPPAGAPATLPGYAPQVVGRGAGHLAPGAHHSQPFIPVPGSLHFAPMPHPVPAQFAAPMNGALYAGQPAPGPVDHLVVAAVGAQSDAALAAQLHDKAATGAAVPASFVYPYAAPHPHLVGPGGPNCPPSEFLGVGAPYTMGSPATGPGSGLGRGGRGGRLGRGGRTGDMVNYRVSGGAGRGAGRGIPNAPGGSGRLQGGAPHHGRGGAAAGPTQAGGAQGAAWGGQQGGGQALGGPLGRTSHQGAGAAGASKASTAGVSEEVKSQPPPPPAAAQGTTRMPAGTSFRDKLMQGNAKTTEHAEGAPGASPAPAKTGATSGAQERALPSSSLTPTSTSGTGTAVGGGASPSGSSTNDGTRSPVCSGTGAVPEATKTRPATAPGAGALSATPGSLSYAGAAAGAAGASRPSSVPQKLSEEAPKQGKTSPEKGTPRATGGTAATPSWSQKAGSAAAPAKENAAQAAAGSATATKENAASTQTRRSSHAECATPSRRGSIRPATPVVSAGQGRDRAGEASRPRGSDASDNAPVRGQEAAPEQEAVEKSTGESATTAPQGPRSWAERMKTNASKPVVVTPSPSARKSPANASSTNGGSGAAARAGASPVSPATKSGLGTGRGRGDAPMSPESTDQQGSSQTQAVEKKREQSVEVPSASAPAPGKPTGWAARVSAPSPQPAATAAAPAAEKTESVSKEVGREGDNEAVANFVRGSRDDTKVAKADGKKEVASAGEAASVVELSQEVAEAAASTAAPSGPMTWAERARRVKEKPVPVAEPAKPSPPSSGGETVSEARGSAGGAGKHDAHRRGEKDRRSREEGRGSTSHGYAERAGHHRREHHRDHHRGSRGEASEEAAGPAASLQGQAHHAHEGAQHRQGRGGNGAEPQAPESQPTQSTQPQGSAGADQEGGARRRGSNAGAAALPAGDGKVAETAGPQKPAGCYAAVVAASQPAQAPRRWGPQAGQQPQAQQVAGGKPVQAAFEEASTPAIPAGDKGTRPAPGGAWRAQPAAAVGGSGGSAAAGEGQGAARDAAGKEEEPHVLWPRNRPKLKKVVVEQEEEKEAPLLPGQEQKFALPQGRKDQLRAEERRRAKQQVLKQEEEDDEATAMQPSPEAHGPTVGALGVAGGFLPPPPCVIPPPPPTGGAPVSSRGFATTASLVGSVFSTPTTLEPPEPAAAPAMSQNSSAVSLVACVSSADVQKPVPTVVVEAPAEPMGFAVSLAKKEAGAEAANVVTKLGNLPPVSAGFTEPPPPPPPSEDAFLGQAMKAEMYHKLSPRGRRPSDMSPRANRQAARDECRSGRASRSPRGDNGQGRRLSASQVQKDLELEAKRESHLSPRAASRSPRSLRTHSPASGSASPRDASPQANRLLLPDGAVAQREGQRSRADSAHSSSPRRRCSRAASPAPVPPPLPAAGEFGDSPAASAGSSSPSDFPSPSTPGSATHRQPLAPSSTRSAGESPDALSSPQSKASSSPPSASSLLSDGPSRSAANGPVSAQGSGDACAGLYSKRLLVAYRLSKQAASVPALISICAMSHAAATQQVQPGGDFWHHGRQGHGDDSWKSGGRGGSGRTGGDGLLHAMHRKNEGKRAMGSGSQVGNRNEDGWRVGDGSHSRQADGGRGSGSLRDWRRGEDSRGGLSAMAGGLGGFFNQERPDPGEFRRMQQSLPPPPSHAILKASESSWVKKQAEQKKDEQQQLLRRLKGHLNKLTLEKFEKLYPQILNAGIKEKEEVNALMKMVFEKAVSQHHFIQMYVQLCSRLKDDLKQILADDAKGSYFRRILINQCEDSFVANLEPMRVPEGLDEDEAFEFAQLYKARMKGNMIFVGELLKSRMISHRILLECIDRLLQKRLECIDISGGEDQGVPHMEALCAFLHTVGPFFENPKWKFYEEFCERIKVVQKLQKDESLPFRVRCLLKDVLDNRAEKWRKKFAATKEGPTRLSELHQQAQLEQQQQQYSAGILGGKGRGFDTRGGDDGGWEMATSRRGVGPAKAKPGMNPMPMNANSRMGGGETSKPMSAFSALGRMRSEREKERESGRDDNLRRENWGSSFSKRSPANASASATHVDASSSHTVSASGPSSLLGRAPAEPSSPAKDSSRRKSGGEPAAPKTSSGAAPMSEEQQVAAARSEMKDLVQSMDLNTALEMLKEMNLSQSVHKEIFDEWLKYSIEALVADKEHVNKQRAIAFQLFVQVCQKGILQAEALKACLKQFMSNSSAEEGEDGEAVEDSPYSDLKIDVPRLTDFMKEFLQTLEAADPEHQVLSTSTLDDLKGKL
ncbi:MIF4G domain-containing protein, partial [Toxoplasma gondii RUB]